MNEFDLNKLNDTLAGPSEELKSRTLAAMQAKENEKTAHKRPGWRRIALCAAVFSLALVLMGAGVKVFDYLAFVPGMGIVTADQSEVYTLDSAVDTGRYRIEAASMIPVTEGEYEGMWQVTLLTDLDIPYGMRDGSASMPEMTLTDEDGDTCTLTFSGGSDQLSYYKGYADFRGSGDYTLTLYGEDYPMTMKSIENTDWANYSFPVSDGLTVVAFPMSVGSRYLVFDVILEPESEEMAYWAQNSKYIQYTPHEVTVTDIEGNVFYVSGVYGHGIPIPESEKEHGINSLLQFKMEYVLDMIDYPTLPVAKIEIGKIDVNFEGQKDAPVRRYTIPQLGETVSAQNLPDGGVFYDDHGIRLVFDHAETCIDEGNNAYCVNFHGTVDCDFSENVSNPVTMAGYIPAKEAAEDNDELTIGGSFHFSEDTSFRYRCFILGSGDRKKKVMNAAFGDEIGMKLASLQLTFNAGWTIDFTAPSFPTE